MGPLQTITTSLTLAVAALITGCDNSPTHSKPPPSSHANTQNLELAKPIKKYTVSKFLQDKNLKLKDLKEYSKYLESATDIGPKDFDSVAEFIVSLFKQPDKISETMNSIKPEILEDLYKIIDLLKTHTKNWEQIQKINPVTGRTFSDSVVNTETAEELKSHQEKIYKYFLSILDSENPQGKSKFWLSNETPNSKFVRKHLGYDLAPFLYYTPQKLLPKAIEYDIKAEKEQFTDLTLIIRTEIPLKTDFTIDYNQPFLQRFIRNLDDLRQILEECSNKKHKLTRLYLDLTKLNPSQANDDRLPQILSDVLAPNKGPINVYIKDDASDFGNTKKLIEALKIAINENPKLTVCLKLNSFEINLPSFDLRVPSEDFYKCILEELITLHSNSKELANEQNILQEKFDHLTYNLHSLIYLTANNNKVIQKPLDFRKKIFDLIIQVVLEQKKLANSNPKLNPQNIPELSKDLKNLFNSLFFNNEYPDGDYKLCLVNPNDSKIPTEKVGKVLEYFTENPYAITPEELKKFINRYQLDLNTKKVNLAVRACIHYYQGQENISRKECLERLRDFLNP